MHLYKIWIYATILLEWKNTEPPAGSELRCGHTNLQAADQGEDRRRRSPRPLIWIVHGLLRRIYNRAARRRWRESGWVVRETAGAK